MKTYLVGGAVRDALLGLAIKDADYVVVNGTVDIMLAKGFSQVGRDFPVFLHPKTKEEYALARMERKVAKGHGGFSFEVGQKVSLEDDLKRRDLTINAMAQDENGKIIDPFNGQKDLNDKILRHVSEAFCEDPLRILRVARFYARYVDMGFSIDVSTKRLMAKMTREGQLSELSPERIYQEIAKALTETKNGHVFFSCLREIGALNVIMPELDALFGVPQTKKWHPEIDAGVHTLMVLQAICQLSDSLEIRFAALLHDLGKATTYCEKWPSHHGHDLRGLLPIESLCLRLKVPKAIERLCLLAAKYHTQLHNIKSLSAKGLLKLLEGMDAYRRPETLEALGLVGMADARGRTNHQQSAYPQKDYLLRANAAITQIDIEKIVDEHKGNGLKIKEALHKARLVKLKAFINNERENG